MKLTMNYMDFYPERELHVVAQMLNNAKMLSSIALDQMENREVATNTADTQEAHAEDNFVYEEFLGEVDQLANRMTVIALHTLIELTLKRILVARSQALKKVQRMDGAALVTELAKLGLDLKTIPGFPDIDELRSLSNLIKHAGNVTVKSINLERYYVRSKKFLQHVCKYNMNTL